MLSGLNEGLQRPSGGDAQIVVQEPCRLDPGLCDGLNLVAPCASSANNRKANFRRELCIGHVPIPLSLMANHVNG